MKPTDYYLILNPILSVHKKEMFYRLLFHISLFWGSKYWEILEQRKNENGKKWQYLATFGNNFKNQ